jgi:hypothetical protein
MDDYAQTELPRLSVPADRKPFENVIEVRPHIIGLVGTQ